jgi:hypothetical protein
MSAVASLFEVFDDLLTPEDGLGASEFERWPGVLVAKSPNGLASLLLPRQPGRRGDESAFLYQRIEVTLATIVEVDLPSGKRAGCYAILTCSTPDPKVQRCFFRLLETLVDANGGPVGFDLIGAIKEVGDLLRTLQEPSYAELLGLWGELLVLSRANDPEAAAQAWHVSPSERYDFAAGASRLEVKTATGRVREHHFSLEQLNPSGSVVTVASVLTEKSSGGTSVGDLLAQLLPRLGGGARTRVESVVLATLGDDWNHVDQRFDLELALESLALFAASDIPSVPPALPTGVTRVQFTSDLSSVAPLASSQDPLVQAVWPSL